MNNVISLQEGDTIGIISPSSPVKLGSLDAGIRYLNQKGYKVKLGKHVNDADRFLAGKDEDRAKDIIDFFKDPEIKAIIASRGGQGSQRLLPLLDYDLIRQNPKILIGFSDTTALQLGLLKKSGLESYTGYTLTVSLDSRIDETLMHCLTGRPYKIQEGITVASGIANGPLIGGNLSLLTSLLGTPFQPDFAGCILLIEDVEIEPFKLDGMLSHLHLSGIFNQVAGLIFGQFEQCIPNEAHKSEEMGTADDVIKEWSTKVSVPCLKDFPYGHGKRSCVLPIGKKVSLNASECTLDILS